MVLSLLVASRHLPSVWLLIVARMLPRIGCDEYVSRDAHAALSYLETRSDVGSQVVLFGQSLGGAVAIELAREYCQRRQQEQQSAAPASTSRINIAGIIVENTYDALHSDTVIVH